MNLPTLSPDSAPHNDAVFKCLFRAPFCRNRNYLFIFTFFVMPSDASERICWQPQTQLTVIFWSLAIFVWLNVNCVICILWWRIHTMTQFKWRANFCGEWWLCNTFSFQTLPFFLFLLFFSSSVTWGAYFIRSFYFLLQFCRNNNYSVVEWVQKKREII